MDPMRTHMLCVQLLALASRMKKDAMRLLHTPSLTVFSNWPTARCALVMGSVA